MEGETMMKKVSLAVLAVLLFLAASLPAAQEAPKSKMREEVVQLNYVSFNEIEGLLVPFLSKEGNIRGAINKHLFSIKDYPENAEKILAFIRKIDVRPVDLAFTIQLILASASNEAKTDESLADDPILKELRSFLRYKNFTLLDTSFVRAVDRERSRITMGTSETEFNLDLEPVYVSEGKTDLLRVNIDLSQRWESIKAGGGTESHAKRLIESNLSLKPGESTVVGVSKMGGSDKGLILIISGKVVK
jgi:hypothetical protein